MSRSKRTMGYALILTGLLTALGASAGSADIVNDQSPHDLHELAIRLDLGGDTIVEAGDQRYVTVHASNPTEHNIYLFAVAYNTTGGVTTVQYAPIRSFTVHIKNLETRATAQQFSRNLEEAVWFLFRATITPTGQETFFVPANDMERPIFGFLLDTAGLSPGEYEIFVMHPTVHTEITVAQGRFVVAAAGSTQAQTQTPETPWQTNAYGTLTTNVAWNYNMGYQFIPQVNGKVTKLGGFFNGTKKVRLYDSSGSVLAMADVTANTNNSWAYTNISPVQLTASQTYTVAVNLAGAGGSNRNLGSLPLPKTFGKIQILKSVYRSASDLVPTTGSTAFMYGQADIEFVPDQ